MTKNKEDWRESDLCRKNNDNPQGMGGPTPK